MKATLKLLFTLFFGWLFMALAQAQPLAEFPVKTVHLIAPFPPGGNTVIGTDEVARSAPDGHVLGLVTGSHIVNPLLGAALP